MEKISLGYTIKDLEVLTGIKAHTIRIWEKRYNILNPERSDSNIRQYNDNDLKRLMNISILNKHGFKISKIACFTNDELAEKIINLSHNPNDNESQIESLILAMIELDDKKFEKIISTNSIKMGFEDTILKVIYPFFERIGLLWQIGAINAAQEHFVSNLLRQKLIVAIDGQMGGTNEEAKRFMLFLPDGEYHELGLLFYTYILKKSGHKIIYLGQSVPFHDLKEIAAIKSPDYLVTSLTNPWPDNELELYFQKVADAFKDAIIYISGKQSRDYDTSLPANIIKLTNTLDFKEKLKELNLIS
ncbi:MAG: MerR family transcriptional regulator [Bacteroidales bacterium]|nr:MerR family transcriptional regulator [Bacteroidales bacterium]